MTEPLKERARGGCEQQVPTPGASFASDAPASRSLNGTASVDDPIEIVRAALHIAFCGRCGTDRFASYRTGACGDCGTVIAEPAPKPPPPPKADPEPGPSRLAKCRLCGDPFEFAGFGGSNRMFCSQKCRKRHWHMSPAGRAHAEGRKLARRKVAA